MPTLLIIGQRDKTAPGKPRAPPEVAATLGNYAELGRAAHKLIPGSKLVEIPGVGHLPMVENFAAYSEALSEFLR